MIRVNRIGGHMSELSPWCAHWCAPKRLAQENLALESQTPD
jgi:hypothetical protein